MLQDSENMVTAAIDVVSLDDYAPAIQKITERHDKLAALFAAVEQRWGKELSELNQAWSESQQALDDAAGKIEAWGRSIGQIASTIDDLQSSLDEAATGVRSLIETECAQATQVLDASWAACGEFRASIDARVTQWSESLGTIHGALDTAAGFLDTGFSRVAAAADSAADDITAAHDAFVAHSQAQMLALSQVVGDFSSSFRDEYMANALQFCHVAGDAVTHAVDNRFITPMSSAVAAATNTIEETAGALIDQAAHVVGESLDKVTESLTDATASNSATRQMMGPLRDELKPIIEPLEDIVDSVSALASSLGVS
jgi:phage-related protein